MVEDELIEIYDANLRRIGVMGRAQAHKEGHWHQTFHCWIINGTDGGAVLFQLRSAESSSFPGTLDVTSAGHLTAGEPTRQGVREVFEELGIHVDYSALHELGYRIEAIDEPSGDRNREYQAVYMLRSDDPLSKYRPAPSEVSGLFWLHLDAGLALFSGVSDSASVSGIEHTGDMSGWKPVKRIVTIRDFLPRIQKYYLTVCIMAERLLQGKQPLGIS